MSRSRSAQGRGAPGEGGTGWGGGQGFVARREKAQVLESRSAATESLDDAVVLGLGFGGWGLLYHQSPGDALGGHPQPMN